MKEFDAIKDMVYCEIDDISHSGKLDMNSVKVLGELVDILKDIGSVEMFEEGVDIQNEDYSFANRYPRENGYSQKRMPIYYEGRNGYDGRNSYDGGNGYDYSNRSYNRGYSRRNRNYSYDDSKTHMIDKLSQLMMEATDQRDKDNIQRLIEQMNNN